MRNPDSKRQAATCARFGATPLPSPAGSKLGIAENVRQGLEPIHGVRVRPLEGTTGWFVWAGDTYSESPDFFVPLCVEHLKTWCPRVIPYLSLPVGWRFVLAPGHEDVWFDEPLARSEAAAEVEEQDVDE